MTHPTKDFNELDLGSLTLESGQILEGAKLAYKTYGTLNRERNLSNFYSAMQGSVEKDPRTSVNKILAATRRPREIYRSSQRTAGPCLA